MSKFRVGDKVRVIKNLSGGFKEGTICEVTTVCEFYTSVPNYSLKGLSNRPDEYYYHYEKELELFKKTIRDVEVGDIIRYKNNCKEHVIIDILENSVLTISKEFEKIPHSPSNTRTDEGLVWRRKWVLEKSWEIVLPPSETIIIDGKTYNKAEVSERLSELKPVE